MDINGDGRLDILTGSIAGDVVVFLRNANGTYGRGGTLRFKSGRVLNLGRGSTVVAADWRGKGVFDLIIGNAEGAIYLVPNEGTRSRAAFAEPERLKADGRSINADGGSAGPCVADWDGDGLLDLIVGCASGKVEWYRNVGSRTNPKLAPPITLLNAVSRDGRINTAATTTPKRSGAYAKVCTTDWNGDGRLDLLVGDYSYNQPNRLHGWVWVYLRTAEVVAGAPQTPKTN